MGESSTKEKAVNRDDRSVSPPLIGSLERAFWNSSAFALSAQRGSRAESSADETTIYVHST